MLYVNLINTSDLSLPNLKKEENTQKKKVEVTLTKNLVVNGAPMKPVMPPIISLCLGIC
jgi:hypothetical protein